MTPRRSTEPITRISVFLYDRQRNDLNEIHERTGIPVSVLIRQGVDLILAQHGVKRSKGRARR